MAGGIMENRDRHDRENFQMSNFYLVSLLGSVLLTHKTPYYSKQKTQVVNARIRQDTLTLS
jgi:hypothetical protein